MHCDITETINITGDMQSMQNTASSCLAETETKSDSEKIILDGEKIIIRVGCCKPHSNSSKW